jgi:hypothetical protein
VAGYHWEHVDAHLRLMCERGIISSGGAIDYPAIGIFFSHLTPAGRRFLAG